EPSLVCIGYNTRLMCHLTLDRFLAFRCMSMRSAIAVREKGQDSIDFFPCAPRRFLGCQAVLNANLQKAGPLLHPQGYIGCTARKEVETDRANDPERQAN